MHQVKLLADVVDVARRSADRWYVTTGHAAVGPVKLDLIARGVEAGKVPVEAFVRHEAWKVWRPLSELAEIVSPDADAARESTDDIHDVGRPSTPNDFLPGDAVEGAGDEHEALSLLMTAAVMRSAATAAIVHRVDAGARLGLDGEGAVVVCAHGARMAEMIGARTSALDPALVAAALGATVIAEPTPGPAGKAMIGRLGWLAAASPIEGAIMIPIRVRDRLVAMIELGRESAFRSSEIASLEDLVEALVIKLERWCP